MKISISGMSDDITAFCDWLHLELVFDYSEAGGCALFFTPNTGPNTGRKVRLTDWQSPVKTFESVKRDTWQIFTRVAAERRDL